MDITIGSVVPELISGPKGTVCVDPAIFHELVLFKDAINLGVIMFLSGLILGVFLFYAHQRWGGDKDGDETSDG